MPATIAPRFVSSSGELSITAAHVENPAAADVADEFKDQLTFEPLGDGADLRGAPSRVSVRPQVRDVTSRL